MFGYQRTTWELLFGYIGYVRLAVWVSRVLSHVTDIKQVRRCLEAFVGEEETAFFHTILDRELREKVRVLLEGRGITSVYLLGPIARIIGQVLQVAPADKVDKTVPNGNDDEHLMDASFLDLR